jgi:hypothetical protein
MERAIEVLTVKLGEARAGLATYAVEVMAAVPPAGEVGVSLGAHRDVLATRLETISTLERAIVALGGVVPVDPVDRVPSPSAGV